jgi:hypothetical protein
VVRRGDVLLAFNFSDEAQTVDAPEGSWNALMETGAKIGGGTLTLPPSGFAVWGSR